METLSPERNGPMREGGAVTCVAVSENVLYMDTAIFVYPALALAGCVAGALNVVAGGGSFLTLPILIFFGLPPGVANGTNRVAILLQNVVASWGFHRHGVLDTRAILWAALPATAGAGLGAWAALVISDGRLSPGAGWADGRG